MGSNKNTKDQSTAIYSKILKAENFLKEHPDTERREREEEWQFPRLFPFAYKIHILKMCALLYKHKERREEEWRFPRLFPFAYKIPLLKRCTSLYKHNDIRRAIYAHTVAKHLTKYDKETLLTLKAKIQDNIYKKRTCKNIFYLASWLMTVISILAIAFIQISNLGITSTALENSTRNCEETSEVDSKRKCEEEREKSSKGINNTIEFSTRVILFLAGLNLIIAIFSIIHNNSRSNVAKNEHFLQILEDSISLFEDDS